MRGVETVLLICSAFLFISCSTYKPPVSYRIESERIIEDSYDNVWQRTVEFFATHNTPIKVMDKSSGIITSEFNLGTGNFRNYFDCGDPGQMIYYTQEIENPTGNYNVIIKKNDSISINVKVNCYYQASYNVYKSGNLVKSEKITCNSTGSLEKQFLTDITAASKFKKILHSAEPDGGLYIEVNNYADLLTPDDIVISNIYIVKDDDNLIVVKTDKGKLKIPKNTITKINYNKKKYERPMGMRLDSKDYQKELELRAKEENKQ